MGDQRVGQLARLREVTRDQFAATSSRRVGVLGVAGGNGLDVIDPAEVDVVFGYDVNGKFLTACSDRYAPTFGARLVLVEAEIDRKTVIEPVGLLIANLFVEYIGVDEFVPFVAANAAAIGVVSCVVQRNDAETFVSTTEHAAAFDGLATVASDVDADALVDAMAAAGYDVVHASEYPLPNGKTLVRRDFTTAAVNAEQDR